MDLHWEKNPEKNKVFNLMGKQLQSKQSIRTNQQNNTRIAKNSPL